MAMRPLNMGSIESIAQLLSRLPKPSHLETDMFYVVCMTLQFEDGETVGKVELVDGGWEVSIEEGWVFQE